MKLLEKIKTKVLAAILAIWAWMKLKAEDWKLRDKALAVWAKAKAFWARMGEKWRNTKAYQKLMAMEPLPRRMTVMLCLSLIHI